MTTLGSQSKDNLSSKLYDVGFSIMCKPNSVDREAIYVPRDGSVTYETINDFFRVEIAKKRNLTPEEIILIVSREANLD